MECDRDINKCNENNYLNDYFFSGYYNGFLNDTLIKNKKFLCFKENTDKIQCTTVRIIKMDDDYQIVLNYPFFNLSPEYNEFSCETENCNFIEFLSEYLFCCACHDHVICTRFAHNFNIINDFKLSNEGENSDLTILNNINYISIIFNNGYGEIYKSIYMKNIYPPYCKNISKNIIEEIEINFQELFDKKNDSNYYLIFNEFDSTILTIKTKSHNININESTMLNEDESDFKINLKNKNILNNNLIIIYNILIEETYSSTCSINLIINQYEDLMTSQITIKDVPPIKTDIILESKNILKEETTWKTYLNIEENFQTTYSNIEEIERSYKK